jgi:hypothetical protein
MEGGGPLIEGGGPLIEGGGPLIEGGGIAGAVVAIPIGAPVPPEAATPAACAPKTAAPARSDAAMALVIFCMLPLPVPFSFPSTTSAGKSSRADEQGDSISGKSFTRQGEEKAAARLGGQIKKDEEVDWNFHRPKSPVNG